MQIKIIHLEKIRTCKNNYLRFTQCHLPDAQWSLGMRMQITTHTSDTVPGNQGRSQADCSTL